MSTCADVGSFTESKTSVVQTSNVGFTSEVSDYLVVHTGPERRRAMSTELRPHVSVVPGPGNLTDRHVCWRAGEKSLGPLRHPVRLSQDS